MGGVPVEALEASLEPAPGSAVGAPVMVAASPALIAAVDGEDDLAAWVLEGVGRTTDPLLVLRQWILAVLGER